MLDTGFCECGCGERAPIAEKTRAERGWIKGQPKRFINRHQYASFKEGRYVEEDRGYITPCWIWQRATGEYGHGLTIRADTRTRTSAHRLYWEERHGPVPGGLVLDHLCRVPACVNPDHLEAVTQAVNVQRGAGTKLTENDVRKIRDLLVQGWSQTWIAEAFGVDPSTISRINTGHYWRNLRPEGG
jgi:HNH endonuclease/Helix-turn-helix domain